jgi:lactoylglutathione lyase
MSRIRTLVVFLLVSFAVQGQVRKTVFNHVAFYVKELQRSTVFYKEIIGLDTIPEPFRDGRHSWFSVGPQSHLHIIEGGNYDSRPKDKSMHFCFSVDNVDAFVRKLDRAGIPYEDAGGRKQTVTRRVDGVKQIYIQDPDGFWLEINDARE